MTTLADNSLQTNYVNGCKWLWNNWNKSQTATLKTKLKGILPKVPHVYPPPLVEINKGSLVYGSFESNKPNWQLKYNSNIFTLCPPLGGFLEFVTVPYHELRHAEQYCLMAMGLLSGWVKLIDEDKKKALTVMSDKDKKLIKRGQYWITNNDDRRAFVSWALSIKLEAIQHVDRHRGVYRTLSSQLRQKTQAWYDETYGKNQKNTNNILNQIHRNADAGKKNPDALVKAYKALPSEADAWGVQGVVEDKILKALNKNRITDAKCTPT